MFQLTEDIESDIFFLGRKSKGLLKLDEGELNIRIRFENSVELNAKIVEEKDQLKKLQKLRVNLVCQPDDCSILFIFKEINH